MNVIDELLENAGRYGDAFDKQALLMSPARTSDREIERAPSRRSLPHGSRAATP